MNHQLPEPKIPGPRAVDVESASAGPVFVLSVAASTGTNELPEPNPPGPRAVEDESANAGAVFVLRVVASAGSIG
jgi:hypothetical protein